MQTNTLEWQNEVLQIDFQKPQKWNRVYVSFPYRINISHNGLV
ncbi:hypothetical protein SAMN04488508_105317 [Aquimarina spongiae]|uniref:Uncharacterized protein n=1 Tax=Aquimarina spongiae TaxID=570521 RepID=A0A1M6GJQ3_9FLAO|nr:hypothetical protein SAMN04488508_105317 [Aquimarina spongiae]